MCGTRRTSAVGATGKWPKEPASNGAPCTKALFENKAKGSLSNRLLIQVPNEKAIHPEASMQDAGYLRSWADFLSANSAGDERPQSGRESPRCSCAVSC